MKILNATDLHGDMWKYKSLLSIALSTIPDAVVVSGDLCSDDNNNPIRQGDFIKTGFREHVTKITDKGIHYIFITGNNDYAMFDPLFDEVFSKNPLAHFITGRICEVLGHEFIGFSDIMDYPYTLKDRCRRDTDDFMIGEQMGPGRLSGNGKVKDIKSWKRYAKTLPTLAQELEKLPEPKIPEKAIYVMHMPPAGVGLDCMPGNHVGGSRAIASFIGQKQPLLTLHGHIHGSPSISHKWKERIEKTICIQPGQLGEFVYVTIDTENVQMERKTL